MLIYPLENDERKKMYSFITMSRSQREDLSHLEKNKLLLFAIENNAFALAYDVIQDGANPNASIFDKSGNSIGKMLDVALLNVEKNIHKLDSYLVIHGLLRTHAEFENQDESLTKFKELIEKNKANPEIKENLELLVTMLDVKNKNLLDYPQLFKDPKNIQNSAAFDGEGNFNPDLEQENVKKANAKKSAESEHEDEQQQKKRKNKEMNDQERREKERNEYLDDFSDKLKFDPHMIFDISRQRNELRTKVESLALSRFKHGILTAPEWLKSDPKFYEQLERDQSINWTSRNEKPISNVSDYWLRVQRAELRTSAEHTPFLRGKGLTIMSYIAFAGLPIATPLWLPLAAAAMGTIPVLMPAAFLALPVIGIAIALTKTPTIIANAIDSARRNMVQKEVNSLVKEGFDKGYIDLKTFKESYSHSLNSESKSQRKDILNHKSMNFRIEEFLYAGIKEYNKKLAPNQRMDIALDIPEHKNKKTKRTKETSEFFSPKSKEQAISGLLGKATENEEPDADFKDVKKRKP